MKKKVLSFALAAAFCLGLGVSTLVAIAASNIRTATLEANYMDIKLVVDGIEVTPKDANGKVVEPFASEGTTYLPVRAVASALGKDVTWDGETKTVYIGPKPGESESWMKKLPPYQVGEHCKTYDGSDAKSYFAVGGVNHTEGVSFSTYRHYRNSAAYALWNTNLQYRSMTFKVGHIDGGQEASGKLEVYLDGELSAEYSLAWDGPIQTITIPLNYAGSVKLALTGSRSYEDVCFGIYDISFAE